MPWTVTTVGEFPDEREHRAHNTATRAWDDYWGRILELEIHGYSRDRETAAYGRRWACDLYRGQERLTVCIERA